MKRVMWFDERVRAGRYPGSLSLSAHFKVSLRTAQRDIEFLRDRLRAPLRYDSARKGYAYVDAGFRLPQPFLRKDEIVALLFSRRLLRGIRGGTARHARIRFRPERAAWASAQPWRPGRRLQLELDGSVVLELPEVRVVEVLGLILQHGGNAEVVAPRELRDAVHAEADRLRAVFG